MEELRLLTNIQIDSKPLLQIFLLGQPELRELVLSPCWSRSISASLPPAICGHWSWTRPKPILLTACKLSDGEGSDTG